ncbi:class I SAM-dependent methyltransferase [Virgibacillus sp. C22-A2]|uniref:Class I SAM-dependent methyltransferase n=1 Tax=Virgibacillus tibetensis TaxID=3042313 RepID=A0ABU6KH94_9BACI|nr:class I SAM-dependent methyltransferase [Virgibacillus sp. C22-A2]
MKYSYLECLAQLGVGGAHPGGLQLTKEMLEEELIDESMSILDVGCGTGQTSAYIAKTYSSYVTSLDNNEVMVDKAKKRFTSAGLPIEVIKGNAEKLPFNDNHFDMVLSESVVSFTNASLTLQEIKRVLKPGGIMLAVEMVLNTSLAKEEIDSLNNFYGFTQLLTEPEWDTCFQKAGFKEISIKKYTKQIDVDDLQNAPDFSLSEDIDEMYFELLEKHEYLTKANKDILGFRVFRCC